MNLFEVIKTLSNYEDFTKDELIELAHSIMCIKDKDNPLFPINPKVDLYKSKGLSLLTSFVQGKISQCENCSRCKTRTNVVCGDGLLTADIFVVVDEPELIDDRTGIPLSGAYELKSSNCTVCQNFGECYKDFDYKTKPVVPCKFKQETDVSILKDNTNFPNTAVHSPGGFFSKAVTAKSPENFLANRDSWKVYLNRILEYEEYKQEWFSKLGKIPQLYITNQVKCYGGDDYPEAIQQCEPWLLLERTLCKAPYTLFLVGQEYNFTVDISDPKIWGETKTISYPSDENNIKEIALAIKSFYKEEE